jgi:hypothetical protein
MSAIQEAHVPKRDISVLGCNVAKMQGWDNHHCVLAKRFVSAHRHNHKKNAGTPGLQAPVQVSQRGRMSDGWMIECSQD